MALAPHVDGDPFWGLVRSRRAGATTESTAGHGLCDDRLRLGLAWTALRLARNEPPALRLALIAPIGIAARVVCPPRVAPSPRLGLRPHSHLAVKQLASALIAQRHGAHVESRVGLSPGVKHMGAAYS
jgi:hypothetical protein